MDTEDKQSAMDELAAEIELKLGSWDLDPWTIALAIINGEIDGVTYLGDENR